MEQVCRELNVTIVAFSPIGQGLLTDKLTEENFKTNKAAKMMRFKSEEDGTVISKDLQALRIVIKEMATKYQKSMAQIALNWCICHETIPLVGCRSASQAKDSVGCLGWHLSKDDVLKLDTVACDHSTLESTFYI